MVDAEKSALVVVDVQRFFARPEYPFAQLFEKMVPGVTADYFQRVNSTVLPSIQRLLACFRARKLPILYFAVGCHSPDGRDLPKRMREFDEVSVMLNGQRVCPPVGDPSGAIEDRVAPLPGEMVLTKSSSGPRDGRPRLPGDRSGRRLHRAERRIPPGALLTFALTFGRVRPTGQIVELFAAAEAEAEPGAPADGGA